MFTKTSWLLLKRPEWLNERQTSHLSELLRHTLKTVRSYLLKEEFQRFWEYRSPAWARCFLDEWCAKTLRSQLEPMKRVARMLRNHRELILNWFRAQGQLSSGVVEGFNTKAKLTTRKAFGFGPAMPCKSPCITRLARYPNQNLPTDFLKSLKF